MKERLKRSLRSGGNGAGRCRNRNPHQVPDPSPSVKVAAGPIGLLAVFLIVLLHWLPASAFEVVDIAGRTVVLERPAARVLLGEGRFLVAVALLAPADPLSRVAGMLNEYQQLDPGGYARFEAAFPALQAVPRFGETSADSVSLETAIALRPDAAVFGLNGHGPRLSSERLIQGLEAAGIPVVFIDFRDDPLGHTAASMRILGRVLGLEAAAADFADFHDREVARVTGRLAGLPPTGPRVLIEARVGMGESCCFTIARGMFDSLVTAAGGRNIARDRVPGAAGLLNLEYVIAADPDVYLGTAVGTVSGPMHAPGRIALGAGVTAAEAGASLAAALARPGIATLPAVENGRAYAIWHHFYNSPFNVYALQRIARWLHPALFADVDPEATLAALLARIRPVDLSGTYAIALDRREGGSADAARP